MHQGHVSRPISSDLPPHPINDIILKLRVSSSMRSSISSLPLAIYMGPLWSLFLCTVGRYHMCLCSCVPRTLAPSPHCLCAEHTRGRGGREPQKWSQCWKHFYILICVDAHHVHWEDCMAELSWAAALWVDTGRQHAALHRKPLLHMQVIRFHKQLFLWFFFFLSRISVQFP